MLTILVYILLYYYDKNGTHFKIKWKKNEKNEKNGGKYFLK